jgi:hypothetical protein
MLAAATPSAVAATTTVDQGSQPQPNTICRPLRHGEGDEPLPNVCPPPFELPPPSTRPPTASCDVSLSKSVTRGTDPDRGDYSEIRMRGQISCSGGVQLGGRGIELIDRATETGCTANDHTIFSCNIGGLPDQITGGPRDHAVSEGTVRVYDAEFPEGRSAEVVFSVAALAQHPYRFKECRTPSGGRVLLCPDGLADSPRPELTATWGTYAFDTGIQQPFSCRYQNLQVLPDHRRQGPYTDPYERLAFTSTLECTGGATITSMTTRLDDRGPIGGTLAATGPSSGGTADTQFRTVNLPYRDYPRGEKVEAVIAYTVKAPPGRVWRAWLATGCDLEFNYHRRIRCDGGGTDTLTVEIGASSIYSGVQEQQCYEDYDPFEVPTFFRIEPHIRWCAWTNRPDSPGWEDGYVTSFQRLAPTDVVRVGPVPLACEPALVPPGDADPSPSTGTTVRWKFTIEYRFPGCDISGVSWLYQFIDRVYRGGDNHPDGRPVAGGRSVGIFDGVG